MQISNTKSAKVKEKEMLKTKSERSDIIDVKVYMLNREMIRGAQLTPPWLRRGLK